MTQPIHLDFTVENRLHGRRNADWRTALQITNADGTPFNLTGYTLAMTVRAYAGAPAVIATLTSTSGTWQGVTITSASTGQIAIQIAASTLLAAPPSPLAGDSTLRGVYDLLGTGPDGYTTCLMQGAFDIVFGIT